MTRSRRRVFREDVVAPLLVLIVILGSWWIGARVVSELWRPAAPTTAATNVAANRDDVPLAAEAKNGTPGATDAAPVGDVTIAKERTPTPQGTSGSPVTGPPPGSDGITADDVDALRARRLRVPVEGVGPAALSSNFHQSRSGARTHEALDIMAARGTPVLAVEPGRIARLFTSKQGGLTIYQFDPSGSFCYYYAHLDRYASGLDEGAEVQAGQVIGFVGSTGNASPDAPHLHFAVFKLGPERHWWQGEPIDPYLVLR
jgi:peptidoglycan LD-endopeptidase LytH